MSCCLQPSGVWTGPGGGDDERVDRRRLEPRAGRLQLVRAALVEERFRHLAASAVVDTHEQHFSPRHAHARLLTRSRGVAVHGSTACRSVARVTSSRNPTSWAALAARTGSVVSEAAKL